MRNLIVASLLLVGATRTWSQSEGVELTTNKPVYSLGLADPMIFTVRNSSGKFARILSIRVMDQKGESLWASIYQAEGLAGWELWPGASVSWKLNKRDSAGKFASPQTYRLSMQFFIQGSGAYSRELHVAVTPTGRIAGTGRFPLAQGNSWTYLVERPDSIPEPLEFTWVSPTGSASNLYWVRNLLGADRWAGMTGVTRPVLRIAPNPMGPLEVLFRFNRAVGFTYAAPSIYPPGTQIRVTSTHETVVTSAGTFTNCYRLDTLNSTTPPNPAVVHTYWFAQGIGLVRVKSSSSLGPRIYSLRKAELKGSDGRTYMIGRLN